MPGQKDEEEESLSWGEMLEVNTLILSFKDGIRDKEAFILRMVDLLNDKKIQTPKVWNKVWEEIIDIMGAVGLTEAKIQELFSRITENYNRSKN